MPARTGLSRNARAAERTYKVAKRRPPNAASLRSAMVAPRRRAVAGNERLTRPNPAKADWRGSGPDPRKGLSQGFQAGLGQQLSSRVASGAVDQEQAQRTAGERGVFQQAYGDNWRQTVYGDRGYVKRVRAALTKDPDNPELQALYEQLMGERAQMLAQAKAKLAAQ